MRIILDTNVVVSAFATRGLCADLFHVIVAEHELVLGETVLAEVSRVLSDKLRLPKNHVDDLEAFLRRQATVVKGPRSHAAQGLDSPDARVLSEAVAGAPDVLVSGDGDLLELVNSPVRLVSPRGLWDVLRRAT